MMEPTSDPPSTDAPGLIAVLNALADGTRKGVEPFEYREGACDAYDTCARYAEPFEARRLATEAEAAALRLRLETAEAALLTILQHRPVNEIAAYYMQEIAELALKPDSQPPPHLDRISVLEAALRAVREVPLDPTRINKIVEGALKPAAGRLAVPPGDSQ